MLYGSRNEVDIFSPWGLYLLLGGCTLNLASLLVQAGLGMSGSEESHMFVRGSGSESTTVCMLPEACTAGTFSFDVKHMYWRI